MRKVVVLILVAALIGSAPSASIAKKKKKTTRTAEASYVTGSMMGPAGVEPVCATECVTFEVEPGERYVDLEIDDALGQPVYASVFVYGYTDGTDTHEHVCSELPRPLPLQVGLEELVIVIETAGGAQAGCNGPPTEGTVVATFSNLP